MAKRDPLCDDLRDAKKRLSSQVQQTVAALAIQLGLVDRACDIVGKVVVLNQSGTNVGALDAAQAKVSALETLIASPETAALRSTLLDLLELSLSEKTGPSSHSKEPARCLSEMETSWLTPN